DNRAFLFRNQLGKFFDGFRPDDSRNRNAVNRQCETFSVPSKMASTRFPISAVLVVVCFPTSVQARGLGKIFAGFKRPSGLKTFFTRIIVSRSCVVKTRSMKSFFS